MTSESKAGLPILAFGDAAQLEAWLDAQPPQSPGFWLKLSKKGAAIRSVTKAEAIDAALCHGWIDGQLDRYDESRWLIRFTPRRPRSKWSDVNRKRALQLIEDGRMRPAGLAEVAKAKADGRWEAAYAPQSRAQVPADLQAALDANPPAAEFFSTLKGADRYAILYRIAEAKRPETRVRRIETFVAMLERGQTLH